jgi:hypothetical protein
VVDIVPDPEIVTSSAASTLSITKSESEVSLQKNTVVLLVSVVDILNLAISPPFLTTE